MGSEAVAGLLYRHKTSMLKVRDASHRSVSLDSLWHGQTIFSCRYFGILSSLANINLLTSAKGVCMTTGLVALHLGVGRSSTTGMNSPTAYKRQEGESEAWIIKNSLAFRLACSVLALINKDKDCHYYITGYFTVKENHQRQCFRCLSRFRGCLSLSGCCNHNDTILSII